LETETFTNTLLSTIYSTYKLCDEIPRAVVTGNSFSTTTILSTFDGGTYPNVIFTEVSIIEPSPIILSIVTITITTTYVNVIDHSLNFPSTTTFYSVPHPSCTFNPTDCASLYAASSNAQWTSGSFNRTASPPVSCGTIINPETAPCNLYIPTAQLIYWPVTLVSQDLCVYPNPIDITAIPAINANKTITIATGFGTTFTSDQNCYIYFSSITAEWLIGTIVIYSSLHEGILTIPFTELQSYRGHVPGYTIGNIYSFNFADLLPNHIPILAYEDTYLCNEAVGEPEYPFCNTVLEDIYAPNLVYPTKFYDLYPQWTTCGFNYIGLFDPRTYLIPADVLTLVSTTANTAITASPVSSQNLVTPPPTSGLIISLTIGMVEGSSTATKVGSGLSENDLNEDESSGIDTSHGLESTATSGTALDDSEHNGSFYTSVSDSSDPLSTPGTTITLRDGSTVTISMNGGNNDVVIDGSSLSQGQNSFGIE